MSEMITASALKHRIILQKPVYSRDEMGGTATFWVDSATLWAAIEPMKSVESFEFQKDQFKRTHKITCRYRADIAPNLRFRKGGRVFHIKSVLDVNEEGHTLEAICEEN
jgi:SPP1 family predicted phage head-tail adaptor